MTRDDHIEHLRAAYERARYEVDDGPHRLSIRVGEGSAALDALLSARGATAWAFVTACNPASHVLPEAENAARMIDLARLLEARGLPFLRGFSDDGSGGWREASVLVPGMDAAAARALAGAFGQSAVVVGESGGPARLVWARDPES